MKIHRYESYIVLIVVFITILLNIAPFLYRSFTTPPGRVFTGAQFYTDDYAVYVSYIKQGQQGQWRVIDKYTSEPHSSSFIHEEYLLWGKLTRLFGLPPILAYHLGRAFFGLIFLFLIYWLVRKIFPQPEDFSKRISCLLLICFGNGFLNKNGQLFLNWLTEMDPSQRFGSLIHYLWGFSISLAIFLWYFGKSKNWLWPLFLGLILSFVLPTSLLVVISTLGIFLLLSASWRSKNFPRLGMLLVVLGLAALPGFFYYRAVFRVLPWSHILAWEQTNRGPFTFFHYLLALGPISFLAFLGLFSEKERNVWRVFLFSWVGAVFLWAFFLADRLGLNPTRFLQFPVYIPLVILAVLGGERFLKRSLWLGVLVAFLIALGLPTTVVSLKNQKEMYADFSELIYPGTELKKAFDFLSKNTSPDQTVLTLYQAGNLIPFMTGNSVYLGHLQETIDYPKKIELAVNFFAGGMKSNVAKDFLASGRIDLVFLSPQEKSVGGKIDSYSFLKPIYSNNRVTIFQFINE